MRKTVIDTASSLRFILSLFMVLFSGLPLQAQFLPPQLFELDPHPDSIALGDVNNDSRVDIIAGTAGDVVQVLLQEVGGGFASPVQYPEAVGGAVDVGDFNDDGLLDVVAAHSLGIILLLQTQDGTLEASEPLSNDRPGYRIRVGDFDHDGRDDVASLPHGINTDCVYLFMQGDEGLSSPPTCYLLNHSGFDDVKAGDLNGDGRDDLVAVSAQGPVDDNIAVILQNPQGGFFDQVLYDVPGTATFDSVAIGDLDMDDRNDLILGRANGGPSIEVFLQSPAGTLSYSESLTSATWLDAVEIRDLDEDGLNEIIGIMGSNLVVFNSPAHPDGFAIRQSHPLLFGNFSTPQSLYVQDINGDQIPDVAVANDNRGAQILLATLPIFADGFESGNTSAWSSVQP